MSVAAAHVATRPALTHLLPAVFIAGLFGLSLLPRIAGIPVLHTTFVATAALLASWYGLLMLRARMRQRPLVVEVVIVRTHYVQALVQGSIYVYWSTAWPVIGGQLWLIVGQWCFSYACTMLVAWTRRGKAELGFGPLPIILSTNFFLCFRDEWFYLQFAMVALGVFGKEFLRWQRDGRNTHIFNPSVFGLASFSLMVILTGSTGITWAQQNAIELGRPEHIYLWIFAVGLLVQGLFRVTLVTCAAAATLWLLNLAYTQATGIYWFLDAGIPIAVFLGLHLLITDPATSPSDSYGRFLFGILYGAGVFLLYGILEWAGVPRFYDKLLFVPIFNLLVPLIDRYARSTRLAGVMPFAWIGSLGAQRQNLLFMGLWVAVFAAMYATHVVGPGHPGKQVAFWDAACTADKHNACRNLRAIHEDDCYAGHVAACYALARTAGAPHFPSGSPQLQALAYANACDLGDQNACRLFSDELQRGSDSGLRARCGARDAQSCYALGTANLVGLGIDANREAAVGYFAQACELRHAAGCGNLAEVNRFGVGTPKDWPKALAAYDKACALGYVAGCLRLSEVLAVGEGVAHDERRAGELFERACRMGSDGACGRRGS